MAVVTYIEQSGKQHDLELDDGTSVMDGAISHLVKGIVGECGGGLACATCHCYVEEAWIDRVSPPSDAEKEMLEGVAGDLQAGSRLRCQLPIGTARDGLELGGAACGDRGGGDEERMG